MHTEFLRKVTPHAESNTVHGAQLYDSFPRCRTSAQMLWETNRLKPSTHAILDQAKPPPSEHSSDFVVHVHRLGDLVDGCCSFFLELVVSVPASSSLDNNQSRNTSPDTH